MGIYIHYIYIFIESPDLRFFIEGSFASIFA